MSVQSTHTPTGTDRFFINAFESLSEATILAPLGEIWASFGGVAKDTVIGCPLCNHYGVNENQVSLEVGRHHIVTTYDIQGNPSIRAWNKDGWYTFWE